MNKDKFYNFLIVDDVEDIRFFIEQFLESDNYTIAQAKDGKEALDKIKTYNYDMVISDINMPVMSGIELIKQVRDLGLKTPFIFVSAYGNEDQLKEISSYGAYKIIDKIEIAEIREYVENSITQIEEEEKLKNASSEKLDDFLSILKNVA